jgi:hypothetical protein
MRVKLLTLTAVVVLADAALLAQEPSPKPVANAAAVPATSRANDEELTAARRKLVALRLRLGENHPEVQKQLRLIAALQKSSPPAAANAVPTDKASQLEAAKQELAKLRERYTDEHPLVKNQLRKIAELEK